MTNSKLINKDALLAEIERLDEFYHASKNVAGAVFLDNLRSFIINNARKPRNLQFRG